MSEPGGIWLNPGRIGIQEIFTIVLLSPLKKNEHFTPLSLVARLGSGHTAQP